MGATPNPFAGLHTVPAEADPFAGLRTVPAQQAQPGSQAEAGGSWTPTLAQDIAQSGFAKAHPLLAKYAAEPAANFTQGVGTELTDQGIRLAKYISPKGGAYLQKKFGAAAQPVPGAMQTLGRAAANIGEFFTPSGEAGKVSQGEDWLSRLANFAARTAPETLKSGAITALQGGNPAVGAATVPAIEGAASAMHAIAPGIAEGAIGIRRADRAYGATPGNALLEETKGLLPGKIAESAQERAGRLTQELEEMADRASVPTIAPRRATLALPGDVAPPAVVPQPLHEATAVVERPSILQPAGVQEPTFAQQQERALSPRPRPLRDAESGRMVQQQKPELASHYITSPASDQIPGPEFAAFRTPAQRTAASFLDRLADEGAGGVTYPSGHMEEGEVAHPLREPLRTTRRLETAQGVRLRPVPAPEVAPITPRQAGWELQQPTVSLRPALDSLDARLARASAQNNKAEMNALARVRDMLTTDATTGEAIPENITARRALDLKRGVRKAFAHFASEPEVDRSAGSKAAKEAAAMIDAELDRHLGPEFADKNQLVSSLLPVAKRAASTERGAPTAQRILGRIARHSGALAAGAAGAYYGAEHGGLGPALEYGTLGLAGPEIVASPAFGTGLARTLHAAPAITRYARALAGSAAAAATRKK